MPKFRKKPVVIEAIQLNYKNWGDIYPFIGGPESSAPVGYHIPWSEASDTCGESDPHGALALDVITTHGETAVVRHGDWIIPDSKPGTFYPCKPDVFEKTYEPI